MAEKTVEQRCYEALKARGVTGKHYEQIKKISYYNNLCDMCGFDYCARNLRWSILFVNNGEH